jgi:hypothetical protein
MKHKAKLLVIIFVGVLGIVGITTTASSKLVNSSKEVEVSLSSAKDSYRLGEIPYFDIILKNKGTEKLSFLNTFNVYSGGISIYISKGNKERFIEYLNRSWGTDDGFYGNLTLNQNESKVQTTALLWNDKPKIADTLAPEVIKRATEGKINTDYVFMDVGTYFVKVTYAIHFLNEKKPVVIESEPIKITITEPEGEDLDVWKRIKDDGNFAYFIQEGETLIPGYKTEERAKFLQEVEQILIDHPNSFYTESLRQSLEKFRASEAKRQGFLQKLQNQKEKP